MCEYITSKMNKTTIDDVKIVELPRFLDARGNLSIVALSGSFDVVVDDGKIKKTFALNRSYYGLYVPAGLWREMENFSTNALALEFGSEHYSKEDYIRDYELFKTLKTNGKI